MKLQILITQYDEDKKILDNMLKSIDIQQGVDLQNDIEVIIGNDGSDVILSEDYLARFKYPIKYLFFEHSGLPGCRQHLLDNATADYVMFCDADDMFLSMLGLNAIFQFIDKGFDAFASEFYEENKNSKTGEMIFGSRKHDSTFVHGKVYRRQYLLDNDIHWHPELKGHEDSCFNILAQKLTKDFVYCSMPFYLWKWRDGSICRKDKYYIPKTYKYLIDSHEQLVLDFLKHGDLRDAQIYANMLVYNTYYCMNENIWQDIEGSKYISETEHRFVEFYLKHSPLVRSISKKNKKMVLSATRQYAEKNEVYLTRFSFSDWFEHLGLKER